MYFKHSTLPKLAKITLGNKKVSAGFSISGTGKIEMDWGDNTTLQTVVLTGGQQSILHYFDNSIPEKQYIIIHGDIYVKQFDCSGFEASSVIFFRPVPVEKLILKDAGLDIGFIFLLKRMYDAVFTAEHKTKLEAIKTGTFAGTDNEGKSTAQVEGYAMVGYVDRELAKKANLLLDGYNGTQKDTIAGNLGIYTKTGADARFTSIENLMQDYITHLVKQGKSTAEADTQGQAEYSKQR